MVGLAFFNSCSYVIDEFCLDEPPLAHPEALISGRTQSPPLVKLAWILGLSFRMERLPSWWSALSCYECEEREEREMPAELHFVL